MSVNRVGKSYKVRWWDGRKRRSKSFRDLRAAKAYDQQKHRDLADRRAAERLNLLKPSKSSMALSDAVEEFVRLRRAEWTDGTATSIFYSAKRLLEIEWICALDLDEINAQTILRIRSTLLEKQHEKWASDHGVSVDEARRLRKGEAATEKTMTLLKSVIQLAIASEWRNGSDPFALKVVRRRRPQPQKRVEALSPFAVEVIRAIIPVAGDVRPEFGPMAISLGAYAGLRPGMELRAADREDDHGATLAVYRHLSGDDMSDEPKSQTDRREVAICGPLRGELDAWYALSADSSARASILQGAGGARWSNCSYRNWRARAWNPTIQRIIAGYDDTTNPAWWAPLLSGTEVDLLRQDARPYVLRHCYASLLLAGGVPPYEAAYQIGDDLATLSRRYAHLIRRYAYRQGTPLDVEAEILAARLAVLDAQEQAAKTGSGW